MAVCVKADPHGQLYLNRTADCRDFVMITSQEYNSLVSHQTVTAVDAGSAISFGFAVVFGLGFLSTYVVSVGKKLIRMI